MDIVEVGCWSSFWCVVVERCALLNKSCARFVEGKGAASVASKHTTTLRKLIESYIYKLQTICTGTKKGDRILLVVLLRLCPSRSSLIQIKGSTAHRHSIALSEHVDASVHFCHLFLTLLFTLLGLCRCYCCCCCYC